MKRLVSIIAFVVSFALLFTACAGPAPAANNDFKAPQEASSPKTYGEETKPAKTQAAEEVTSRTGGTLSFGEFILDTALANRNPFVKAGTWGGLRNYVYEELFYFNGVTGELLPALGDSYEWSADNLTLTIKLNEKAKWHDGEDFDSADVLYTINTLKTVPSFDTNGVWKKIDRVSAPDANTIEIKVKEFYPTLLIALSATYIVPEHIWSKENAETFVNPSPVGTGPFKFVKYNTGTDIQFEAFLDYWRGAPQLDKIICKMYNSSPNVTLAFMSGDIEYTMGTIAMPNVPEILNISGAKIQFWPGPTNFVVHLNHENEFLKDPILRKALNIAIDPEKMLQVGNYGIAYPIGLNWLHEAFGDYVNKNANGGITTHGIDEARKFLTDNGYKYDKSGKLLTPAGKKVTLTYHNASGAPAQQEQANMIQQWFTDIGVDVIPKLATWAELGTMAQNGNYDMLQQGITFLPSPYAALSLFHSSLTAPSGQPTTGLNYFRYRSAEMDKLLDEASTISDPAKLKEIVYKIQETLANDYVFVPMYNGGPKAPYHTARFEGYDTSVPIYHPISLIKIKPVKK